MVTYLFTLRGTRHFVPLLALVLASFIPAFLTLNRGMFVGLGIAAVVIAIRHILNGNFKVLVGVGLVAVLAVVAVSALPVEERLDNRLESSGTNESRMTVYTETISAVAASPWFGYGAPRPTESTIVPLGTQGQVWMVLFSHGFVGLALFLGFFLLLIGKTIRNRTMFGITWNSVLIVLFVQSFYYGLLIQGLLLGMLVAAIALREGQLPDDTPPRHLPSNLSDLEALVGSTPRKAL
jgi:O-antigen ligase